MSELQEVNLVLSYFLSIFLLIYLSFSIFVPRVRVNDGTGHIA